MKTNHDPNKPMKHEHRLMLMEVDGLTHICTECNTLSKDPRFILLFIRNISISIATIVCLVLYTLGGSLFMLFAFWVSVFTGVLLHAFAGSFRCRTCGHRRMIPVDTPRARRILKELDHGGH